MNHSLALLFMTLVLVGLFSFLIVGTWTRERRREREAYYRSETLKKIAETQGSGGSSAMEFLQESEKYAAARRREGLKLGGLVTVAVGLSMMIFIAAVDRRDHDPGYLMGIIPLFIGAALLSYVYLLGPKQ
jgi:hypothetical protein